MLLQWGQACGPDPLLRSISGGAVAGLAAGDEPAQRQLLPGGQTPPGPTPSPSSLLRAVARRDALVLGVLCRKFSDHGRKYAVVRGVVVGDDIPGLAVPLMHACLIGALVVLAGELDGLDHAFEAQLLDARLRQAEV